MPLVQGGHNCPSLTAMPSRAFLIRQACLCWLDDQMPATTALKGAATAFRFITPAWDGPHNAWITAGIRRQFRKLVAKHGGTTCPSL